jgi:hypothetical protein
VAVFLTSRRQEDLEVKYDFSVQKADGVCWGRIGNTFKKFSPEQNSWGYGKAFSKAKLLEKQSELLPDNKLTIVCNLVRYFLSCQSLQTLLSKPLVYTSSGASNFCHVRVILPGSPTNFDIEIFLSLSNFVQCDVRQLDACKNWKDGLAKSVGQQKSDQFWLFPVNEG